MAVCVRLPDEPVKLTVGVAAAAPVAAVRVVVCAVPGVSERVAGVAVTPAGSPPTVTATAAEKPLAGTALTLMAWPGLPATSVTVAGVAASEKSAGGAGVDGGAVGVVFEPPPHDTRARFSTRQAAAAALGQPSRNRRRDRPIVAVNSFTHVRKQDETQPICDCIPWKHPPRAPTGMQAWMQQSSPGEGRPAHGKLIL